MNADNSRKLMGGAALAVEKRHHKTGGQAG